MARVAEATRLAIEGGTPAVTSPLPRMYPGGMRIGREEEEAVLEVLRSKRLFRYYGPHTGSVTGNRAGGSVRRGDGRQARRGGELGQRRADVRAGRPGRGTGGRGDRPGLHLDRVGLSGRGHGGRAHPGRGRRVVDPRPSGRAAQDLPLHEGHHPGSHAGRPEPDGRADGHRARAQRCLFWRMLPRPTAAATTVSDSAASATSAPSASNSTRSSPAAKAAW